MAKKKSAVTSPPPAVPAPAAPIPYQTPPGSETEHRLKAGKGARVKATADWIVVRRQGRPIAEMFFTFYRADASKKQGARRPLTFLFNGGPGAASAYLHVGTAGPYRVRFNKDGTFAGPAVDLIENEDSWLPFTDLVFIDPVGTGFSRAVEESRNEREPFRFEKGEKDDASKLADKVNQEKTEFFGVNRDIEVLVQFVTQFLSRFNRWESPIYLAGESYGGYRVGKLVRHLHEDGGVGLSGAIFVSPALEISSRDSSDYDVAPWVDLFPTMAAAAHFHGRGRAHRGSANLASVLEGAEAFAGDRLSRLLLQGQGISEREHVAILNGSADYLGLDREFVRRKEGRIPFWIFARELLREQRLMCGYYDASNVLVDPFPDRDWPAGPDPTSTLGAHFAAGINTLLRSRLGVKTDRDYVLLSFEAFHRWRVDQERHFMQAQLGSVDDIRYGAALNPHLKLSFVHGIYDLVTPYFATKRLVNQMKFTQAQLQRVHIENYPGGHMFYTWESSRRQFTRSMAGLYR